MRNYQIGSIELQPLHGYNHELPLDVFCATHLMSLDRHLHIEPSLHADDSGALHAFVNIGHPSKRRTLDMLANTEGPATLLTNRQRLEDIEGKRILEVNTQLIPTRSLDSFAFFDLEMQYVDPSREYRYTTSIIGNRDDMNRIHRNACGFVSSVCAFYPETISPDGTLTTPAISRMGHYRTQMRLTPTGESIQSEYVYFALSATIGTLLYPGAFPEDIDNTLYVIKPGEPMVYVLDCRDTPASLYDMFSGAEPYAPLHNFFSQLNVDFLHLGCSAPFNLTHGVYRYTNLDNGTPHKLRPYYVLDAQIPCYKNGQLTGLAQDAFVALPIYPDSSLIASSLEPTFYNLGSNFVYPYVKRFEIL